MPKKVPVAETGGAYRNWRYTATNWSISLVDEYDRMAAFDLGLTGDPFASLVGPYSKEAVDKKLNDVNALTNSYRTYVKSGTKHGKKPGSRESCTCRWTKSAPGGREHNPECLVHGRR